MDTPTPFTGRSRQRTTRWGVRVGEILSRLFITVGGIGTIVAILTVFVFLVWKVVPLFLPASVKEEGHSPAPWSKYRQPLHLAVDEYQVLGWALFPDGSLQVFRLDTGKGLEKKQLFPPGMLTAFSYSP